MINDLNNFLNKLVDNVKNEVAHEVASFEQAFGKKDDSKIGNLTLINDGNRAVSFGKGVYSEGSNRVRAASYVILAASLLILTIPFAVVAALASPSLAMQENKTNRFVVEIFKLLAQEVTVAAEMLVAALLTPYLAVVIAKPAEIENAAPKETEPLVVDVLDEQTTETPLEICHRKANDGDANAQFELYEMYNSGTEVEKDENVAIEWLTKAAKNNHPAAQYHLGHIFYLNGHKLLETAKTVESKTEENGVRIDLTQMRFEGNEQLQQAKELFKKSAEQKPGRANLALGICYYYAHGTKHDLAKARENFQLAVDSNEPRTTPAYAYLADLQIRGFGGEQDIENGLLNFDKAIEKEDKYAAFMKADFLMEGKYLPQDIAKAKELFEKADTLGHSLAKQKLEEIKALQEQKPEPQGIWSRLVNFRK